MKTPKELNTIGQRIYWAIEHGNAGEAIRELELVQQDAIETTKHPNQAALVAVAEAAKQVSNVCYSGGAWVGYSHLAKRGLIVSASKLAVELEAIAGIELAK